MNNRFTWCARVVLASVVSVLVCVGSAAPAHAALDEVLQKNARDVSAASIAGHALKVRVRGTLKEFADANGKVFAASWRGTAVPNYIELLGAHYPVYQAAVRARRPSDRNHFVVRTRELSLEVFSIGRMIIGKVILLQNLPHGVNADALE